MSPYTELKNILLHLWDDPQGKKFRLAETPMLERIEGNPIEPLIVSSVPTLGHFIMGDATF